jgi:NTP pyrophosphatase (non-canonical NTP hydrolase)
MSDLSLKEQEARKRAKNNVEEWGQQSPGELLLAIGEEAGELADEILTDLDQAPTDFERWESHRMARDFKDAGLAVQHHLDRQIEEGTVTPPVTDMDDTEAVREELYDLMALLYQLDWAIYQGVTNHE